MSSKVDVVLAHPYKGKGPGERVSLEAREAEQVVTGGGGVYATKGDAAAAGAPEDQAKTARKS